MPACSSFQAFADETRQVFGRGSSRDAATGELHMLRQGQRSVMDFGVDFQILARQGGWPPDSLSAASNPATTAVVVFTASCSYRTGIRVDATGQLGPHSSAR